MADGNSAVRLFVVGVCWCVRCRCSTCSLLFPPSPRCVAVPGIVLQLVGQIKKTRRPITLFFRSDEDSGDGDRSGEVADYVSTPTEFDVTFGEGPLGLLIHKRQDVDQGAVVSGFKRGEDDNKPGPAEACGMIAPGQILIAINGKSTLSTSFKKTIKAFVKAPRYVGS